MRIEWNSMACEPPEVFQANVRHARTLGLPFVTRCKRGSLAVAGGGPSLLRYLDKLRSYDEVWGINRTAQWLCGQGIPATFFTVDPQYVPGMTDVEKAILASCVHPKVFEELQGKDVSLFHIADQDDGEFVSQGGPSSACRAIPLAVHMHYSSVTFFGCEGSYERSSHAYINNVSPCRIVVRANGKDHFTQPDYQMQCEYIVPFLADAPGYFKEESGGLLRAMAHDPDWENVAFSGAIYERILPEGMTLADLPPYEPLETA
jgi:hypothetical protein